jgi:2-(acetamidomethylene)succinate hydrolase
VGPSSARHREKVSVGDISLSVEFSGEGAQSLVLLHGVTANHAVWAPIVDELEKEFHVMVVDQRGHGLSDRPKTGYTASDYAADVQALIETRAKGGKAFVVGHSLGSRNAIVAAAQSPQLVSGFVGIDFTPFIETEVFDSLEQRVNGGLRSFESLASVEKYLANRYPKIPRDAITRRARHGFVEEDGVFCPLADPSAMAQTVRGLRENLAPALMSVAVPGLLVRGAESALVTEAAFDSTIALRPDLEYARVAGADHYVPEEKPAEISQLVTDFVHRNL